MLSEQQIEALAGAAPEDAAKVLADNVVDIKPKELTAEEQVIAELKAQDEREKAEGIAAMKRSKELPFTAEAIGAFAKERFEARLPAFIKNTENQIRTEAAYGADGVELKTAGAENYHNALVEHIRASGFSVESHDGGTANSKLRVVLY